MAYIPGQSDNIIVGAASFFVAKGTIDSQGASVTAAFTADDKGSYTPGSGAVKLPGFESGAVSNTYADTLIQLTSWTDVDVPADQVDPDEVGVENVGYTVDGLELTITPDFGEVTVDQVLDAARLFKQGMTAAVKTTVAEATLQNLLYALALDQDVTDNELDLSAGGLGECAVERGFVAIGPGSGDCSALEERVYIGYRGLSTEAVTVTLKRDAPSQFDINLRLLPHTFTYDPADVGGGTVSAGSYGRIVDRQL